MATQRKKKQAKLKFELSRSGVFGIGVVSFCVFLWMFLLGIWVGQKVLFPVQGTKSVVGQQVSDVATGLLYLENNGKTKKTF